MHNDMPALPFTVDVNRVLYDANALFNPLHRGYELDFHVSAAKDGYVYLSLVLPEGMTRVFVSLLESLAGLVRCIDIKSRAAVAEAKSVDPSDVLRRKGQQDEFRRQVFSLFDGFVSQGCSLKEAVSRTNSALKASGSPWATYEVVRSILSSSGRFRTKKEVKT